MKVLILSCSTGEGHNATARAVVEQFRRSGDECQIRESLRYLSNALSCVVSRGHSFIYRYLPGLFRNGYEYAERHPALFDRRSLFYKVLKRRCGRLRQEIIEEGYDAVLCTHVFAAMMTTIAMESEEKKTVTAFLATDYTCSPIVGETELDLYFIPADELTEEFVRKGIPAEKIRPSGIPVRNAIYTGHGRKLAKGCCGVASDRKHLVLACGSMGCGPISTVLRHLDKRLRPDHFVTVVCGNNKRLCRKLTRRYQRHGSIRIKGYVEDMSLLLDSADLYLTKPGGISVTEAAVKKLPMVLLDTVAGCESYNLRYFEEKGCAKKALSAGETADLCVSLLDDPAELERMRRAFARSDRAADRIVQELRRLYRGRRRSLRQN